MPRIMLWQLCTRVAALGERGSSAPYMTAIIVSRKSLC